MKNLINKILKPFHAEIHGTGYLQSLAKGEFKNDAFIKQAELISPSKVETIFDLGANRGMVIMKYLELFPKATIHAFEPYPESFEILKTKFQQNNRVVLNQIAISNENETKTFFVNKSVDTNSLLSSNKTGLSSDQAVQNLNRIKVDCITLQEYCKQHAISSIDILKMDIQGGEYDALLGAKNLLIDKKIKLIYTESFLIQQYKNVPLLFEIGKLLSGYGYQLQDIYDPHYGQGKMAWCDVIFI